MEKKILSAFVVVRNEEKNIANCLGNLNFCDEIIVVDQQSTDNTVVIAKKYTKKVFIDKCWGHCEPSRLLALKKCKGDWILNIDADESISPLLRKEILEVISKDEYDCFYVHRNLVFMGKVMKHFGANDYILRLHKRNSVNYSPKMHSSPTPKNNIRIGYLRNHLDHANVEYDGKSNIRKIKYYAKTQANNDENNKKLYRRLFGIIYVPVFYFLYNCFIRGGILDGKEGIIYSYLEARYHFEIQKHVWLK